MKPTDDLMNAVQALQGDFHKRWRDESEANNHDTMGFTWDDNDPSNVDIEDYVSGSLEVSFSFTRNQTDHLVPMQVRRKGPSRFEGTIDGHNTGDFDVGISLRVQNRYDAKSYANALNMMVKNIDQARARFTRP